MEDRETPQMHKYGESKTTRIMMATVRHVTSSSGLRKFQAAWFLLNKEYILMYNVVLQKKVSITLAAFVPHTLLTRYSLIPRINMQTQCQLFREFIHSLMWDYA